MDEVIKVCACDNEAMGSRMLGSPHTALTLSIVSLLWTSTGMISPISVATVREMRTPDAGCCAEGATGAAGEDAAAGAAAAGAAGEAAGVEFATEGEAADAAPPCRVKQCLKSGKVSPSSETLACKNEHTVFKNLSAALLCLMQTMIE